MAGLLEDVRVGIEGHARARVAEDAADLDDVEADVEDQMAREGMAQIVEPHPPIGAVDAGVAGSSAQHTAGDVVMKERGSARGREHVVGQGGEACFAAVLAQHGCELGKQRDLAHRRSRFRCHPMRWDALAASRKLRTNVDHARDEVDILPGKGEYLGQSHPGVDAGREQRPVTGRTVGEQADDLGSGEHALVGGRGMGALVSFETRERMLADVAASQRITEDAAERAKDPLDRPW